MSWDLLAAYSRDLFTVYLMFLDTDTGFNPNGTLAGPTLSDPLGNPVFPGFTSSGGENWVRQSFFFLIQCIIRVDEITKHDRSAF